MPVYYDFRFGDENAGYQIYERGPDRLTWWTRFRIDDEEIETSHEVELEAGRLLRFRADGGRWIAADAYPAEACPTSGVTLLLERMAEAGLDQLDYLAIDEATGELDGPTRLRREGDWILEEREGEVWRRFQMRGCELQRVDWGGPIATLRASEREARAGSPYPMDAPDPD